MATHLVRIIRASYLISLFILFIHVVGRSSHRFPKESLSCKLHHVDQLDCSNRNLRTVPIFEYSAISNTTTLDLHDNKLEQLGNQPFRLFSALQILDLSVNKIVNISVSVFTWPNVLQDLDLSHNNLMKLKADVFKGLVNLRTLKLSWNSISDLLGHYPHQPSPFQYLTLLEHIYVDANRIHNIEPDAFDGLRDLQTLALAENRLEQLPCAVFKDLNALRVLDLSMNKLLLPPSEAISPLNMLETLDLSSNTFSTLTLGEGFKNLTRLLKFTYDNSEDRVGIANNTFQNMPNKQLNSLSFRIKRDIALELGGFKPLCVRDLSILAPKSLEVFKVMNCSLASLNIGDHYNFGAVLNDDTLDDLAKVNKSLVKLRIKQGHLERIDDFAFFMLKNLVELRITRSYLEYISYYAFEGLNNLSILDLSFNYLRKVPNILRSFHNLITLNELDLSLNRLDNIFYLDDLANLTALEKLYLQGNALYYIWCKSDCPLNIRIMWISYMNSDTGIMLAMVIHMNQEFPRLETLYLEQAYFKTLKFVVPVCVFAPNLRTCDLRNVGLHYRRDRNETSLMRTVLGKECKHLRLLDISRTGIYLKFDKQSDILLPNLDQLIANENRLYSLKNLSFLVSPKLTILKATDNWFTTIERIHLLDKLEDLRLSGNKIESLEGVSHLSNLRHLYLGRNMIKNVSKFDVVKIEQLSLDTLDLSGNPFDCTCDIEFFRKWIFNDSLTNLPNQTLHCSTPVTYTGVSVTSIDLDCTSRVHLYVGISMALALLLSILAILAVRYRWHIKYKMFLIFHHRDIQDIEDDIDENIEMNQLREYHAYVSYDENSEQDERWVFNELMVHLEQGPEHFRLCIKARDFIPGDTILDAICNSIQRSRRTILVLTPRYVQSEWCYFEMQMAQMRLFNENRDVLTLVLLEEIPDDQLTLQLRQLYCKKECLVFPKDNAGQNLFWQRLRAELKLPVRIDRRHVI